MANILSLVSSCSEGIYKKEGKKFGVAGVVSLGCLPGTRAYNPENTDACVKQITETAKLHSRQLAKALLKLKRQRHEFKYSNPNFYAYINERIEHPSKFGLKEGKVACCGSGQYRGIDSCGGKKGVTEYELCDNVLTLAIQLKGFTSKCPSYGGVILAMSQGLTLISKSYTTSVSK
ncbi:unnamed protein product [Prunus armeniaca]